MKRVLILLTMLALLIPAAMVSAQEALEVGTKIRGEITDDAFEFEYTFSGTADSVVVIEMLAEDEEGWTTDLTAQLIVLDSSGSVVVDTSENFVFSDAILVTQLPADDDYTIIATREDGRAGETTGLYSIQLIVPEVLNVGSSVSASVANEDGIQYYVVDSDQTFALLYGKSAGDYDPEVRISEMTESNSDIEDIATVAGDLNNVSLGDIEAGMYIIQVREAFLSFYFDEVTADYTLEVASAE